MCFCEVTRVYVQIHIDKFTSIWSCERAFIILSLIEKKQFAKELYPKREKEDSHAEMHLSKSTLEFTSPKDTFYLFLSVAHREARHPVSAIE